MNLHTLRYVLDFIRRQGKLPTDQFGQIFPTHDLLARFGLSECLTPAEQLYIAKELAVMVEAEQSIEKLRQLGQLRSSTS